METMILIEDFHEYFAHVRREDVMLVSKHQDGPYTHPFFGTLYLLLKAGF